MEVIEKINKAKVNIQVGNPFFAYLVLFLKFKEADKNMGCDTMGVDLEGNVYYNKDFVNGLSNEELIGTIKHEIGHLIFLSELRLGNRDRTKWNFATDIAINSMLKEDGCVLPKGVLMPNYNDIIEIGNIEIKDCSKKLSEEIYDLLPKMKEDNTTYYVVDSNSKNEKVSDKTDNHIESKKYSSNEKRELEKKWVDITREAVINAEMRGELSEGIKRMFGKLHKEKIDWVSVLNQFISNQLPYSYSYSYPHKKSVSIGEYMPHILKEKIDVCVMIDLSGSVGEKEMSDFLSELVGIAKAYQERIDMRILSHDTECYDNGFVKNGNIEKILKMKLKGGGGTSFEKPIKYLKDNNINPNCLIWLTDGYGDKVERQNYPILWVLSKDGSDDLIKNSGEVLKLDE